MFLIKYYTVNGADMGAWVVPDATGNPRLFETIDGAILYLASYAGSGSGIGALFAGDVVKVEIVDFAHPTDAPGHMKGGY